MPAGIGNLTEIRTLEKFIVGLGKENGLNIKELKNLVHLRGELSLEGLHNVEKSEDVRDADLKGKRGLQGLVMRWSDNMDDHMSDGSVETKVLELLQPHGNVERLEIEFYCGLEFPSWLGDPLLMSSMTRVELCNCRKSTSLPSLGRLPMLKHLVLKGLSAVRTLGFEFCGCDSGGFAALETLKFQDMEAWEKWMEVPFSVGSTREGGWKFPRLHKLEIINCPVLVGECLVSLPSLRTLKLEKCNESFLKCMMDMGSLTSLSIREMSGLSCLHNSVGRLLVTVEDLVIFNCEHLVSLWQSEPQSEDNITGLKILEVRGCPELVSLMTRATINKMTSLEKMIVRKCPKIGSIQIDQQQEMNGEVMFPPKLRHLELVNCGDQFKECLGNSVVIIGDECVLVDYLIIEGCDTLQHLAIKSKRRGNKVKLMKIRDCRNLVSLSNSYEIAAEQVQEGAGKKERDDKNSRTRIVEIEKLEIQNCPSLTSDGLQLLVSVKRLELKRCSQLESVAGDENHKMSMPWTTVKEVSIMDCPNLKSLADRPYPLTNLTKLDLEGCDGLELFPERGLPFPNLFSLWISECQNLKSMPNNMQRLTTLTELHVEGCGGLKSFPGEGSLPPNLENLIIRDCPNVKQKMSEWKLDTLSSLEHLWIKGVGDGDFKDMLLPNTLKSLTIIHFHKLEYISSTCASSSKCFHLHKNLTSLAYLYISDCLKLRCLPKEGLPPTLESLEIRNSPIIGKKCIEGKGKYWSRISFIPYIEIE